MKLNFNFNLDILTQSGRLVSVRVVTGEMTLAAEKLNGKAS